MLVAQDAPPVCLDDRLKIELFAEQPQLVTPTGIDVDHLGRVFVIESNTHFPPEGYAGHPSDRILILENTAENPQADKVTVFADGLKFTMSVAVEPIWLTLSGGRQPPETASNSTQDDKSAKDAQSGGLRPPLRVFVATRNEILLLTDTDGDLKADETKRLVHLETQGNYPHNGLAGFAFDALGNLFFGFGENLGADYKIIGSDGTTLSGGGEGGNLYRCKPDGSKLERWATGFWNPHASCFDAFGRLFTVDNDPDSRPPCRLLHIIPGGDYGYRFRNGRKGTHPFTSWNGEIPGTLPMVAGTGEAPSGIVCYENDGFPADYLGTLLVGSWGDHRIDQFVLKPRGASFTSKAKPIIQGGENFRPVGLAVAPDGSFYFSDWVLKDYKLHGKGRVWRVSGRNRQPGRIQQPFATVDEQTRLLKSNTLIMRRHAAALLGKSREGRRRLLALTRNENGTEPIKSRFEAYWSLLAVTADPGILNDVLDDDDRYSHPDENGSPQRGDADELYRNHFWWAYDPEFRRPQRRENIAHAVAMPDSPAPGDDPRPTDLVELAGRLAHEYLRGVDGPIYSEESMASSVEDPFIFQLQVQLFSRLSERRAFEKWWHNESSPIPIGRLVLTLAQRLHDAQDQSLLPLQLKDSYLPVRRAAVQWIGEENLVGFRPEIEAILAEPTTTPDLFLACLATLQLLDGKPASEFEMQPPTEYVVAMVKDTSRPAALRTTALRMLPPSAPELEAPLLAELLSSPDESLRTEAARTLAGSQLPEARELLLNVAANPQATVNLRAEAIAGLCRGPHEEPLPGEVEALLLKFAQGEIEIDDAQLSDASQKRGIVAQLQLEGLRSLRGRATKGSKIRIFVERVRETASDDVALQEALDVVLTGKSNFNSLPTTDNPQLADPLAGRRVFFHHNGPLCAKCHVVQGRGGQVGPDLTVIARTMNREKLLASILEPSKEIAPQFTTWIIETTAGKTHTGFILEDNRNGQIKLGTPAGEVIVLDEYDIETREPSKTSVMPEKLHQQMTSQELRDLLAFLETLK